MKGDTQEAVTIRNSPSESQKHQRQRKKQEKVKFISIATTPPTIQRNSSQHFHLLLRKHSPAEEIEKTLKVDNFAIKK